MARHRAGRGAGPGPADAEPAWVAGSGCSPGPPTGTGRRRRSPRRRVRRPHRARDRRRPRDDRRPSPGASLQYAPVITPWARVNPTAPPPSLERPPASALAPSPSGGSGGSGRRRPVRQPTPTPGPFEMDLYEAGDYAGEYTDTWCVPGRDADLDEHHGRGGGQDEGDPAQRVQPRPLARPRTGRRGRARGLGGRPDGARLRQLRGPDGADDPGRGPAGGQADAPDRTGPSAC